jgi:hypothetical protein
VLQGQQNALADRESEEALLTVLAVGADDDCSIYRHRVRRSLHG